LSGKGSAEHQARDDAFGSRDKGERDYESGGDRPTNANYAQAYEIGQEHGLHESDDDEDEED